MRSVWGLGNLWARQASFFFPATMDTVSRAGMHGRVLASIFFQIAGPNATEKCIRECPAAPACHAARLKTWRPRLRTFNYVCSRTLPPGIFMAHAALYNSITSETSGKKRPAKHRFHKMTRRMMSLPATCGTRALSRNPASGHMVHKGLQSQSGPHHDKLRLA